MASCRSVPGPGSERRRASRTSGSAATRPEQSVPTSRTQRRPGTCPQQPTSATRSACWSPASTQTATVPWSHRRGPQSSASGRATACRRIASKVQRARARNVGPGNLRQPLGQGQARQQGASCLRVSRQAGLPSQSRGYRVQAYQGASGACAVRCDSAESCGAVRTAVEGPAGVPSHAIRPMERRYGLLRGVVCVRQRLPGDWSVRRIRGRRLGRLDVESHALAAPRNRPITRASHQRPSCVLRVAVILHEPHRSR